MALLNALRGHHGSKLSEIEKNYRETVVKIVSNSPNNSETAREAENRGKKIRFFLFMWGKVMIAPIWIFSGVVFCMALGVVFTPWEIAEHVNQTGIDAFIVGHCIVLKCTVGALLSANIGCYVIGFVAQRGVRQNDKHLNSTWGTIREQQSQEIKPAGGGS